MTSDPASPTAKSAPFRWLVAAMAVETALVILHFLYGAHLYDEPSREHVLGPAVGAFVVGTVAVALSSRFRHPFARWGLAVMVGVPFLGVFGGYHGAFAHGLKLVLFAHGVSPERLEAIFDSPDFAVPNDVVFEASGLSTFFASIAVGYFLVRVARLGPRRGDDRDQTTVRPRSVSHT